MFPKLHPLAGLTVLSLLLISCAPEQAAQFHKLERGPMDVKVEASGSLESSQSRLISPPRIADTWRFTITYLAAEGKEVAAGEPVVRFDDKKLKEKLSLARSKLASSQKSLEIARLEEQEILEQIELDLAEMAADLAKIRRKLVIPAELIIRNELQKTQLDEELAQEKEKVGQRRLEIQKRNMHARFQALENQIELTQATVATLERDIQRMVVPAPVGGLVVYRPKWDGDKFIVGETAWASQTLIELPDLNQMRIAAVIAEPDAGKVAEGQEVEIRLDANPDRIFKGRILSLGKIFRRKSPARPTIVFDAIVDILDPDPKLMRPGMAAELKLLIERKPNVLRIPEKAISYTSEGPVVKLKAGITGQKTRPISLGVRSDGLVEVLEGLREGDMIQLPQAVKKGGGS